MEKESLNYFGLWSAFYKTKHREDPEGEGGEEMGGGIGMGKYM